MRRDSVAARLVLPVSSRGLSGVVVAILGMTLVLLSGCEAPADEASDEAGTDERAEGAEGHAEAHAEEGHPFEECADDDFGLTLGEFESAEGSESPLVWTVTGTECGGEVVCLETAVSTEGEEWGSVTSCAALAAVEEQVPPGGVSGHFHGWGNAPGGSAPVETLDGFASDGVEEVHIELDDGESVTATLFDLDAVGIDEGFRYYVAVLPVPEGKEHSGVNRVLTRDSAGDVLYERSDFDGALE